MVSKTLTEYTRNTTKMHAVELDPTHLHVEQTRNLSCGSWIVSSLPPHNLIEWTPIIVHATGATTLRCPARMLEGAFKEVMLSDRPVYSFIPAVGVLLADHKSQEPIRLA